MSGTAKFTKTGRVAPSTVRLGYRVTVDVANLDLTKVPADYTKATDMDLGGGTVVHFPPQREVSYDAVFNFTLKDRDGFTLLKLASTHLDIVSGKKNYFQALATEAVPTNIAARTEQIFLVVTFGECTSCAQR